MARNLSTLDAWQKLLCGETVAACRLGRGAGRYLRRRAQEIGREFKESGFGAYTTFSLN